METEITKICVTKLVIGKDGKKDMSHQATDVEKTLKRIHTQTQK